MVSDQRPIANRVLGAANISVQRLATGGGEMRPAGLLPGVAFAGVVMVELRDIHAALTSST